MPVVVVPPISARGRLLVILTALLAAGCRSGGPHGENSECSPQEPCRVGYICLLGLCRATPARMDGGGIDQSSPPFAEVGDDIPDVPADMMLSGTGLPPAALRIQASTIPSTLAGQDLGNVLVGASAERTFTLSNTGDRSTGAITLSLTGTGFSLVAPTDLECASGSTILGGLGTCTFRVRFTPAVRGAASGSLGASAVSATSAMALPLSGNGQNPANLTISPTRFDFPDTTVGLNSPPKTFTVQNTGDVATGMLTVTREGGATADFPDATSPKPCGAALAPMADCSVVAFFNPSDATVAGRTTSLKVTSGALAATSTLTGKALTPADLVLEGGSTDFGTVRFGNTGGLSFTLQNIGTAASSAATVSVSGSPYFSVIQPAGGSCGVLPGRGTCNVTVRFAPLAPDGEGMSTTNLSAEAGGTTAATRTLTANGKPNKCYIKTFPLLPLTGGLLGSANGITAGPDDQLWISIEGPSGVGYGAVDRLSTSWQWERVVSSLDGYPLAIGRGPAEDLRTAVATTRGIQRVSTMGAVTTYTLNDASISSVAGGPDGNLWFTAGRSIKYVRLQDGAIFSTGTLEGVAASITSLAGNTNELWFVYPDLDSIGAVQTSLRVFRNPIPKNAGEKVGPSDIAVGPDGNHWFTEADRNRIGRLTPWGVYLTGFTVPTADSRPTRLTPGPDNSMWFTEFNGKKIGRVTTAGVTDECPLPAETNGERPVDIAAGPDGNIWFVTKSRIGRVTPP